MTVRPVTSSDFQSIAAIHKSAYSKEHVTAFFSLPLLQVYYKAIWDRNPFAFIAINKSEPVGFVIGGDKLDEPIQQFITTHRWSLVGILVTHPKFIFLRIADRVKRIFGRKHSSTPFQLLSIAVKPGTESGCGKLLLAAFEQQLRSNHITQYGLSVKNANKRAVRFYEQNDFKIEFETGALKHFYKNLNPQNK